MRTITDKDKTALAKAFQSFLSAANGQRVTARTLQVHLERALAEGFTLDELLNMGNYRRAAAIIPTATAADYVDLLVRRQITVRPMTDEQDWSDPAVMNITAEAFHDFFQEVCPKGGKWSTPTAKRNLQAAVERWSLQGLLSEALIEEVKTKSGQGDKLTCFQYVEELLKHEDIYTVDITRTQEQEHRLVLEAREEETDKVELYTEPLPQENDATIYDNEEPESEEQEGEAGHEEGDGTFVSVLPPKDYKRSCVAEALQGISIAEFIEISGLFDEEMSIDEMITALADGDFDKTKETIVGRNAHQVINGSLYTHFIECAAWQGVEISDETASKTDFLSTSWDLRDPRTRKLQKLKELVYRNAADNAEDADLMAALSDLEELYSKD